MKEVVLFSTLLVIVAISGCESDRAFSTEESGIGLALEMDAIEVSYEEEVPVPRSHEKSKINSNRKMIWSADL